MRTTLESEVFVIYKRFNLNTFITAKRSNSYLERVWFQRTIDRDLELARPFWDDPTDQFCGGRLLNLWRSFSLHVLEDVRTEGSFAMRRRNRSNEESQYQYGQLHGRSRLVHLPSSIINN